MTNLTADVLIPLPDRERDVNFYCGFLYVSVKRYILFLISLSISVTQMCGTL